jgi:hypothetical protein
MATITITIPDPIAPRVIEALCYPDSDPTAAKAKQVLMNWIKAKVRNYESDLAMDAARLAAEQDVEQDILLT